MNDDDGVLMLDDGFLFEGCAAVVCVRNIRMCFRSEDAGVCCLG